MKKETKLSEVKCTTERWTIQNRKEDIIPTVGKDVFFFLST